MHMIIITRPIQALNVESARLQQQFSCCCDEHEQGLFQVCGPGQQAKAAGQGSSDHSRQLCCCSLVSQAQTIITCSNGADVPTWPKFQACLLFFLFSFLLLPTSTSQHKSIIQKVQLRLFEFYIFLSYFPGIQSRFISFC